jgi:ankyrin repeat protein
VVVDGLLKKKSVCHSGFEPRANLPEKDIETQFKQDLDILEALLPSKPCYIREGRPPAQKRRERLPPESSNVTLQAAYGGNEKMVLDLLDRGAAVNAGAGNSGNTLQAASHRGCRRAVQILLERGTNVNVEGGIYRNPLYAASFLGHDKVVQVLEDKCAYVDSFGGVEEYCTLHRMKATKKVVQILLSHGTAFNERGGKYGTALQAASFRGHETVVQMLLHKGADMNLPGKHGNTLCLASQDGHDKVVLMLVERDPN